jgi:hypothetical protein
MLLVGTSFAQAPTNDDHDVILLNDGGIARGRILEIVCGDYVTLQVLQGGSIKIEYHEIRLITDKQHYEELSPMLRGDCIKDRELGYVYISRTGLVFGQGATHFISEFVAGSRISRHFYGGIGVGRESIYDDLISAQLHVYFLGDLVKGGGSHEFFLHFSGGQAYNVVSPQREPSIGGVKYLLTLGGAFDIGGGAALMVEAGYYYQSFRESTPSDVRRGHPVISLGLRL